MTGTLFVAILGVVLAAASLGWQAATFALTGSRVKAQMLHGALGNGVIAHNEPGKFDMAMMTSQGMGQEVIGVRVWNRGRLAIMVTGFDFRTKRRVTYAPVSGRDRIGDDPMPHRLELGAEAMWFIPMESLRAEIAAMGEQFGHPNPATLRAVIGLGTQRKLRAKGSMRVKG